MVYVPLLRPALIAIGTYALLLAWNEYLYAFLLLSSEKSAHPAGRHGLLPRNRRRPLADPDGHRHHLRPAASGTLLRRAASYMVSGLVSGATKA